MHYDINLIILSLLVAMTATHAACGIHENLDLSRKSAVRHLPGVVFGVGVWSMHVLGLLARRDTLPLHLDGRLALASLLGGVAAAMAAFALLRRTPPRSLVGIVTAGGCLSLALLSVHHLGMEALSAVQRVSPHPIWRAASLGLALGTPPLALSIGSGRLNLRLTTTHRHLAKVLVLGAGAWAVHHTALKSLAIPGGGRPPPAPGWTLEGEGLAVAALAGVIFVMASNLADTLLQPRIHALRILKTVAVGEMSLMLLFPMISSMAPLAEAFLDTGVLLLLVAPMTLRLQRQHTDLLQEKRHAVRHLEAQQILNRLLSKRLSDQSLKEILEQCLEEIWNLPWMPLAPRGGIFLYRPERQRLELFIHHNMHPALLTLCKEVKLGQCLCGRAGLTRRLLHAAHVDERHSTRYPGMEPHGHYNVPLLLEDELQGVLVLYLEPGHQAAEEEMRFLETLGSTLALIIDRWHKARTIHQMAFYDPLTELPNRLLLEDRFRTAVARCRRQGQHLAVLFLDLDNFKQINDTLGHTTGDHLLQKISERLQGIVRTTDTIARLGGDEFILLLENLEGDENQTRKEVRTICSKLLKTLRLPINLWGQSFTITCSIGVALFPEHGEELEPLLQAADTAMYEAKRQGGRRCLFYDSSYHTQLTNILLIKQELPQALEAGQIYLAYQPQFSLHDGSLTGCEALIRWKHPLQGHVSPAQFIPVAESDGFIIKLGEWILQQACRQKQLWHEAGIGDAWRMGINLSLMQLIHEGENGLFAHTLEKVLEATGVQPHEIELELTETLFAHQDHPLLQANLQHLRQMGVSLAIDDFGTGHSSLGRLKFFPIDTIKVDRVFVRDLTQDSNDEAIVRAIVALGHTLDMRILAEGVETREQLQLLREIGCDQVQGYLTGRPMSPEEFAQLLQAPGRKWPL